VERIGLATGAWELRSAFNLEAQRQIAPVTRARSLQCYAALAVMVAVPALLIMSNHAGSLSVVFPLLSVATGGFLLWRSKPLYVGLVFWLWFVTPFLGRVADFQGGSRPPNPAELAPYLVAGLSGIPLLLNLRILASRQALPYVCALVAILYGTVLGLAYLPLFGVMRALLNWVVPVIFGLFVYEHRQYHAEFCGVIEKSFIYGLLLLGAYGIYQFFVPPEWDRIWILTVRLNSSGVPEPMKTRVFSTMNGPAVFSATMACGLLLLFNVKGKLRLLAVAAGLSGLIFSLSRASWITLIVGSIYLIFRLGMRARLRLVFAAAASVAAFIGFAQMSGITWIVSDRVATLSRPEQDASFSARVDGHVQALRELAEDPWGEGLGSTDTLHATTGGEAGIGPHDSTLLELLYSLGWVGASLYVLGFGLLLMQMAQRRRSNDRFAIAAQAILIGLLAQLLLVSVFLGVLGFMVWTFAAMILSAPEQAEIPAYLEREPEAEGRLARLGT
jgi:hypothetical protein